MNLQDVINLRPEQQFLYEGHSAIVKWTDKIEYLIHQADPKDKADKDIYFRNYAICFTIREKHITLVTMHPSPKTVEMPEFQT